MNTFLSILGSGKNATDLRRMALTTLQVNMGNLCNQRCRHCHVEASPEGERVMSRGVVDRILKFLLRNTGLVLDITGGAPELNPNFDYLIMTAQPFVKEIVVRSNLTVFFEQGKDYLPQFFKEHSVTLICSLPGYTEEGVNAQRGDDVFRKSIEALKILNELGYSKEKNLELHLVYNPVGAYLPPEQNKLEQDYRYYLNKNYGIRFNRLIVLTNVPIKRFKTYLDSKGEYESYLELLKENFNPQVIEDIMCRKFLSVGYDGRLYDCDFNQSLGWALKNKNGDFLTIDTVDLKELENRSIMVGEHCLSCTAGYGSSCQGALVGYCQQDLSEKEVKAYYGKVLKSTKDLKTTACCSSDSAPDYHRPILAKIHPELLNRFYGCGSPIPPLLEGCTVLDLGCGAGKDSYLISALVGDRGFVIGVDMTEEQLEMARRYIGYHMREFGLPKPNIEFKKGYIENLEELGIRDNSLDVVVSNCVINLSFNKERVFSEIFRVLKPGGELYFSDIFTGRRIPKGLERDSLLYGECLGGALYVEDFRRLLKKVGCLDYRIISKRKIELNNPEIEAKIGMVDFYAMTIRAFKLDDLEDSCEDYGESAVYLGTIPNEPHRFFLDEQHIFLKDKPIPVCGNTASMLRNTRYAKHFKVFGDRGTHFGRFDCTQASVKTKGSGVCC